MRDLAENPPPGLEVKTDGCVPVYANEFVGLREGVYKHNFTWGFENGKHPSVYGMKSWEKVTAILPMGQNFLMICESASPKPCFMGVCCHTSLLTPSFNKSCGAAWGNLKNALELEIGPSGPWAIGVGVSEDPKHLEAKKPGLSKSMTFRCGLSEFIIS